MKLLNAILFIGLFCAVSTELRLPVTAGPRLPGFISRIVEAIREEINRQVISFFESQRDNFPTGWPLLGIPPLEPFFIEEIEANIDTIGTLSSIDFRLTNAYLHGLQRFSIRYFDMRIIGLTVHFDVFFDQLILSNGTHTTSGSLVVLPISGSGPFRLVMNDVRINGTFQMNTIDGGYLNLKTPLLNVSVGSAQATIQGFGFVLDNTISALLSASLPALISDSQDRINEIVYENLVQPANEFLNQYRLIDLIFAIIGGVLPFDHSDYEYESMTV